MAEAVIRMRPTTPQHTHGTKRLASCHGELERSWQGCAAATHHHDFRHYVSSDGSSLLGDALSLGVNDVGRAKRHRTLHSKNSNDNAMMTECSFARGIRITPTNRPDQASGGKPQVKAGWYEGAINARGNRHGRGVTKHDDGTEYEGPYIGDVMEGPGGRYQFVTSRHVVPNPRRNMSHLHRQIEKCFVGSFKADMPDGPGMIVTKTVDCAPQVLGTTPLDVRFVEVIYDVGMHSHSLEGKAVGEGVRVIYSNCFVDGRSTLEKKCYRLFNGETMNTKVANDYADWVLQCAGVEFPVTPSCSSALKCMGMELPCPI